MIAEDLQALARPVDSLQLLPGNPRHGDVEAVARSLAAFGQRKPIVVTADGTVTAGNHTLLAARSLGWTEIAAVVVDDDATSARAFALADNRTAELGGYDDTLLAELMRSVRDDDAALYDATGWNDADLDALLARIESEFAHEDDVQARLDAGVYDDSAILDAAFEHYRAAGFPFPVVPRFLALQQLNALAQSDSESLVGTNTAYHVADTYQPHRFTTPITGKTTVLDTFNDDVKLRHALTLAMTDGKLTEGTLLGALSFTRGAQLAAQFRPGFALSLYRRFAPPNAVVLDTSTGFGGRLLAFFASACSTYIGVDPEPRTCAGNRAMVDDLCPADKSVEIIELPVEDVDADTLVERCDFAFTSPPYFGKEQYANDDTQSWVRYQRPADWREGFLVPMLKLQSRALKVGAMNVVNIADVTIKNEVIPLEAWTVESAQALGFEHLRTERFPLPRVPGRGEASVKYEPVLIFRKVESWHEPLPAAHEAAPRSRQR